MGRVRDKVQVMVVDSPLILCIVYNNDETLGEDFNKTVRNVFDSYTNRNYLLTRKHTYEDEGRFQNEKEALEVRKHIINALDNFGIDYNYATSSELDCETIANKIAKEIREYEQ